MIDDYHPDHPCAATAPRINHTVVFDKLPQLLVMDRCVAVVSA
ncbi:hypothetical protein ACFZAV_21935 [Streptomyces sp. NPDC008343]